jgi:hypothetical protein
VTPDPSVVVAGATFGTAGSDAAAHTNADAGAEVAAGTDPSKESTHAREHPD